jgi:hypothetical protein
MSDLGTADAVLRLLLDGQPWTRAELIERSGLARSTVTGRIEALLAEGLVVPSGEAASTGGRPPARFRFNPTARLVLAADVGATHLSVALTDLAGEILHRSTTPLEMRSPRPDMRCCARPEGHRTIWRAPASGCPGRSSTAPGGRTIRRSCRAGTRTTWWVG